MGAGVGWDTRTKWGWMCAKGTQSVLEVQAQEALNLFDYLRDRGSFARFDFVFEMLVMRKTIEAREVWSIVIAKEKAVFPVLKMIAITEMPEYP